MLLELEGSSRSRRSLARPSRAGGEALSWRRRDPSMCSSSASPARPRSRRPPRARRPAGRVGGESALGVSPRCRDRHGASGTRSQSSDVREPAARQGVRAAAKRGATRPPQGSAEGGGDQAATAPADPARDKSRSDLGESHWRRRTRRRRSTSRPASSISAFHPAPSARGAPSSPRGRGLRRRDERPVRSSHRRARNARSARAKAVGLLDARALA